MTKRQRVNRAEMHKVFLSNSEFSPGFDTNSSINDNADQNGCVKKKSMKCTHGRYSKGSVCRKCKSKLDFQEQNAPNDTQMTVFPKKAIWLVFAATLLVRFIYISRKKNRWILNADEVFQIVEIAHSEVYGYGGRPYEYEQPFSAPFSSSSEKLHSELGMYSLRSFLLPKLFMLVFTIADFFGVNEQPFLVAKFFHTLISSCLPLSVYKMTKVLYKSDDVAVMAAIFAAGSLHLSLFGTHVLVNSFLAPLVFWQLANVLELFPENGQNSSHHKNPKTVSLGIGNMLNNSSIHSNPNNRVGAFNTIDERTCDKSKQLSNKNGPQKNLQVIRTGCILGACVYIRPDLVLFVGLFLFPFALRDFRPSFAYFWILTKLAVCFISGMILAGMDDWISYGQWGLSVYQWMRFNFISNLAGKVFGSSSAIFYIEETFLCNWACIAVSICTTVCVVSQAVSTSGRGKEDFKTNLILLVESFIIVTIYSLQPHKESRFIHNVLVVLCIVQANAVVAFIDIRVNVRCAGENYRQTVLCSIACLYVLISWICFPTEDNWSFADSIIPSSLFECMSYISNQNDVTGIFSFAPLSILCFSLFRKNVTVFGLMNDAFLEYSPEVRISMTSLNPWSFSSYNISINTVNKISDIANHDNIAYPSKVLFEDVRYNYAIIPYSVKLTSLGYEDVFQSTHYKVVKRSIPKKSFKTAQEVLTKLSLGLKASILEDEGSKLIEYGLPLRAVSRLKQAIVLDPTRVQPYQLLIKVYSRAHLGDRDLFSTIWRQCVSLHGKELCRPGQTS